MRNSTLLGLPYSSPQVARSLGIGLLWVLRGGGSYERGTPVQLQKLHGTRLNGGWILLLNRSEKWCLVVRTRGLLGNDGEPVRTAHVLVPLWERLLHLGHVLLDALPAQVATLSASSFLSPSLPAESQRGLVHGWRRLEWSARRGAPERRGDEGGGEYGSGGERR